MFDTYSLIRSLYTVINCNYPGADQFGTVFVQNLTMMTSKDRMSESNPDGIASNIPGIVNNLILKSLNNVSKKFKSLPLELKITGLLKTTI